MIGQLVAQFAVAAVVVVVAGTFLTRYADALGEHTGMGQSLAGLVLLALATSLPELTVDCTLAVRGAVDLALGDLLGSSLFNLLILAVLDLWQRPRQRVFTRWAAAHALSATVSSALTAVVVVALAARLPGEWLGAGPGPWAIGLLYIAGLRMVFFDQRLAREAGDTLAIAATETGAVPTLGRSVAGFLAAAAAIFVAAPLLASAAEGLAEVTGLGGTFIGATLVAGCTSLPEAVTTFAAVRAGAVDLAIGNILGSNSFNMAILLPVDLCYDGSLLADAAATHLVTAGCVILVTGWATAGVLYRAERRIALVEPGALVVVLAVLGSLGLVYACR